MFGLLLLPTGLAIFLLLLATYKSDLQVLLFSITIFLMLIAIEILLFESIIKSKKRKGEKKYLNKTSDIEDELKQVEISNTDIDNEFDYEITPKFEFFSTSVSGVKYDGRNRRLRNYVEKLKFENYFFFSYDGLSDEELTEKLKQKDKIWEINEEFLPWAEIKFEPNKYDEKAIAVYVGENESEAFKVGYIPKRNNRRLLHLLEDHKFVDVGAKISGGTFKTLSQTGDVCFSESPYRLELNITLKLK